MKGPSNNHNILTIELNTCKLNPAHIRMIKTLNLLIEHVLTTYNENDYFEGSAEIIRISASLIKQANFNYNTDENVPYSEQSLEFSLEILQEYIERSKVINYDC